MSFILRWIVTAVAVAAAVWLVPGVFVWNDSTWVAVLLVSLILSLIDLSIKPILQLFSIPITVITLGLFYVVVNTVMLYLAAWLANGLFGAGFEIATFGSGFVAALVISVLSVILTGIVDAD